MFLSEHDGEAKISDLDLPSLRNKDVVRFDITVNDITLVQIREATKRHEQDVLAELFAEVAFLGLADLCEVAPSHEF